MFAWLARFIERHPRLHRGALFVWKRFPPRMAGFLRGLLTRNWMVGAVAVMIDENRAPPEVLLVQHSYRTKGTWGLPGGSLESVSGDPSAPGGDPSRDDVIETTLRREIWEEIGIGLEVGPLLRVDAIPYVEEEPGPYRLDFYFKCRPEGGFDALREGLRSGAVAPRSPEVKQIRLVPLTDLDKYDLYSSDRRFFRNDLPRLEPALFANRKAAAS